MSAPNSLQRIAVVGRTGRTRRDLAAAAVALLAHLAVAALMVATHRESHDAAHPRATKRPQRLVEAELARRETPKPEPPRPEPPSPALTPPVPTERVEPTRHTKPKIAEAPRILTAPEGPSPDPSATRIATGQADKVHGGATAGDGTGKERGDATPAQPEPPRPPEPDKPRSQPKTPPPAPEPDRSRPPALRNPSWQCPWPTAAARAGIDSDEVTVVVVVDLDAEGRTTDAKHLGHTAVDHVFGDEAERCARRAAFVPALDRSGAPKAMSGVRVRVRFTR